MSTIWYEVQDVCGNSRFKLNQGFDCESNHIDRGIVSELAAEDYWENHDGWEGNWPLEFVFYKSEDSADPLFRASVIMEAEPQFYAFVENEEGVKE